MKRLKAKLVGLPILSLGACGAVPQPERLQAESLAPLPRPVTNNAVTTVTVGTKQYVVSFAGLGEGKTHADTMDVTFVREPKTGEWQEGPPLPGDVGRLAAVAVSVGELAYVFGGYTVAGDGTEVSTPWVHSFDPVTQTFVAHHPIPVPVDDAVAVTYQDRYIYLISGWHDFGNVKLVQRFDTLHGTWAQATPTPGKGVFGHAGAIVGPRIVYCDGVAIEPQADTSRQFVANQECFLGLIDEKDSRRIDWRTIPSHPGLPRYRMAAAGVARRNAVLFIGGSDNPYNYDGIGYDGEASRPVAGGLLFDLDSRRWRRVQQGNAPSMDHRALAPLGDGWSTIGGMLDGQRVTEGVVRYQLMSQ